MTAVATAPLLGSQTPRLFTPPLRELTPASSLGFEAIRFADDVLGITLMPWQRWLLERMLELNPDGTFRFRTVLIQVARQNGKSTLAQVLSLWRMFVDRSPLVIGTAQNLDVGACGTRCARERGHAHPTPCLYRRRARRDHPRVGVQRPR